MIDVLIVTDDLDDWLTKICHSLHDYRCCKRRDEIIITNEMFRIIIKNKFLESSRGSCWSCAILDKFISHDLLWQCVKPSVKASIRCTDNYYKQYKEASELEILNNNASTEIPRHTLDTQTIKVRYLSPNIPPLGYIDGKSDWIDLYAAEDVIMKRGDYKLIPLGIAVQLPHGYEAYVIPRSSTFKNFGIIQSNHIGIIDESYCGDNDQWCFSAIAMRDTEIHAGDRICQFRIVKHQPQLHFETVTSLGNADRGGFGTTGKR